MIIILICNIIAFILILIYRYINEKIIKEHERRLELINQICEDNLFEDISSLQMIYILTDISSICYRGKTIYRTEKRLNNGSRK